MKKTIAVNISGFIFHVDEDACQKLESYLGALRRSFKDSESREEIIADIEARIAELFREKSGDNRKAICMEDVAQMIEVLGKPEELGDAGRGTGDEGAGTKEPQTDDRKTIRRLFRDPDSRVIGGVCSGVSAYFDLDPIWLRLIFAFSFFMFGAGLPLYVILWIVIPKARTTAEKLQMKGATVNISNIEKNIKEEFEHIKTKVEGLHDEAKNKNLLENLRSFLEKVILLFIELFTAIFRAIAKITGVALVIFGLITLAIVVSSFFGLSNVVTLTSETGVISFSIKEFLVKFFSSPNQVTLSAVGLLILLGVPLLAIVYGGFRLIFHDSHRNRKAGKVIGTLAFITWICGLLICSVVGAQIAKDFSVAADKKETIALTQPVPPCNTLYLALIKSDKEDDEDNRVEIHSGKGKWNISTSGDIHNLISKPELELAKSPTDSFQLEIILTAKGKTKKEALERAANISYQLNQHDSTLEFGKYFHIPDNEKWRGQSVKFVLKVPSGKSVHQSEELSQLIIDN